MCPRKAPNVELGRVEIVDGVRAKWSRGVVKY
jgi:hypothetical protein